MLDGEKLKKPDWWPKNPYPEDIFPMPRKDYAKVVPDSDTRTALSGMLGREFWDIASRSIWSAIQEAEILEVKSPAKIEAAIRYFEKNQDRLEKSRCKILHREHFRVMADFAKWMLGKEQKTAWDRWF